MDFIARAGGLVQKSNRIAGLLLIVLIVQGFFTFNVIQENGRIKSEMLKMTRDQKVYVVPGSTAGIYAPRKLDVLLHAFVDHISQSMKTFTYASLEGQYLEIRKFFTSKMLEPADNYYRTVIDTARQDERSSLFIPQRNTLKVEKVPHPQREGQFLTGVHKITLVGLNQYSLGGSVIEAAPVRVIMEVEETNISANNPFGFKVRAYSEEELSIEEQRSMGWDS